MILFSKPECSKCNYVKEAVDLKKLDIEVHELTPTNSDALGELAWYEAVRLAETSLPILILDDCSVVTGAIKIKNVLLEMENV